jgi:hypothetical protein
MMSAEKFVRYKNSAIWVARDNGGIYFKITDLLGKYVFTSDQKFVGVDDAIKWAQMWIDQYLPSAIVTGGESGRQMTTCLLPGCNKPIPENGDGRPSDFCCNAHRQAMYRLVMRIVRIVMRELAVYPIVGSRAAGRPAVPSSQPLPGAAHTASPESAGQGEEEA